MSEMQLETMKFDPATGEPRPYPSHAEQWRQWHGNCAWLFNPWTGGTRTAWDVGSDTFGRLIVPPGSLGGDQGGAMSEQKNEGEAWYDAEIAPALVALAKRCNERGMSFIASVEYLAGERAGTYFLTADAGLTMRMQHICAMTAPNIDGYMINLARYCKARGIDTSGSIAMRSFGGSK